MSELETARRSLEAEKAQLQQQLREANARRSHCQTERRAKETRVSELEAARRNLETEKAQLQQQLLEVNGRAGVAATDGKAKDTRVSELEAAQRNWETEKAQLQQEVRQANERAETNEDAAKKVRYKLKKAEDREQLERAIMTQKDKWQQFLQQKGITGLYVIDCDAFKKDQLQQLLNWGLQDIDREILEGRICSSSRLLFYQKRKQAS